MIVRVIAGVGLTATLFAAPAVADAAPAGVTVTVNVDPAAPVAGQNVEYRATVIDHAGAAVGNVDFVDGDGALIECPDTAVHAGIATCPGVAPSSGSLNFSASFVSSDGLGFGGSTEASITVRPNVTAITSSVVVGDSAVGSLGTYPVASRGGNALATTTLTGLDTPTALAFDPTGSVWVADCAANTVSKYPPAALATTNLDPAQVTLSAPVSGPQLGVLSCPSGLAFDPAGNLWVSARSGPLLEYRATQLQAGGRPTPAVVLTNDRADHLPDPAGIAFDDFGNLWVANFSSGSGNSGGAIVEYAAATLTHSGAPAPTVVIGDAGSGALQDAEQVAFDAAGDLWVAASASNELLEYRAGHLAASGAAAPDVVISDDGSTSLSDPQQLGFDDGGNLWVANSFSSAVLKYTPAQLAKTAGPTPSTVLTGTRTGLLEPTALGVQRTPPHAPSAPQAPRATAGVRQVALSWSAPASTGGTHVTGYRVLRSTTGTSWTVVASTTSRTATIGGLVGGDRYYYEVEALNKIGVSPPSVRVSAVPYTTPGVPASVRAVAGTRQVSLSWSAPSVTGGSAVTGYRVLRSTNGTSWTTVTTTTARSYRNGGLGAGRPYYFAVEALNKAGASNPSYRVSAVPYTTASAPRSLKAKVGPRTLTLSWVAPASAGGTPVTSYVVQYAACTIGAAHCAVHAVTVRSRTLVLRRLSPKHRYHVRVLAANKAGRSAYTHQVSAVPHK